jgi:hypothetical protein
MRKHLVDLLATTALLLIACEIFNFKLAQISGSCIFILLSLNLAGEIFKICCSVCQDGELVTLISVHR